MVSPMTAATASNRPTCFLLMGFASLSGATLWGSTVQCGQTRDGGTAMGGLSGPCAEVPGWAARCGAGPDQRGGERVHPVGIDITWSLSVDVRSGRTDSERCVPAELATMSNILK